MTRIRYQGRDYHTPAYMPVQEREDIEGMNQEFDRRSTWVMLLAVCIVFWCAVFAWVLA